MYCFNVNLKFISLLWFLWGNSASWRVKDLATKGELGSSLSNGMLAQVKRRALRRGVWFKSLNRVERGILDLTVKCVDSIKSTLLVKLLTAIIDKLHSAMEGTFNRLVRTIGVSIAQKISCIAIGWGNVPAKSWASDLSFAAFLAAMHTNNDFLHHRRDQA
jgi:hypothetical protein